MTSPNCHLLSSEAPPNTAEAAHSKCSYPAEWNNSGGWYSSMHSAAAYGQWNSVDSSTYDSYNGGVSSSPFGNSGAPNSGAAAAADANELRRQIVNTTRSNLEIRQHPASSSSSSSYFPASASQTLDQQTPFASSDFDKSLSMVAAAAAAAAAYSSSTTSPDPQVASEAAAKIGFPYSTPPPPPPQPLNPTDEKASAYYPWMKPCSSSGRKHIQCHIYYTHCIG